MRGVGMGIAQKIFLSKEPVSEGFYLIYGATYKYFDIDGNNFIWVEYTGGDGLDYQHMQVIPSLYMDFFVGFGVKYAFHQSPEHVTVKYNRGINDFGYIGTLMVGGIRIGIGL